MPHHREAFAIGAVTAEDQAGGFQRLYVPAQLTVGEPPGAEAQGFVAGIDGEEGGR